MSRINGPDRHAGLPHATRSESFGLHGMVASSQPAATQIGVDILKAGGNAIDAAIAVNAALTVVEPTGCGLGGDLFAIVWDAKTQQLHGLNASGRSPQSLTMEHFKALNLDEIPTYGPLSVSVPGCVDGWDKLMQRFGSKSWSELLSPAIELCEEGFPVTEVIADGWGADLAAYPGFAEQMLLDGKPPRKGQVFKRPNLAKTMRKIVEGGRDAFYKGETAAIIEQYMKENGGFLTAADLAAHESNWVAPVKTNYRGFDVWELPPSGQGIAVLQMLNLLEPYDLAAMGPQSVEYLHLFLEAKKLAFEDRAHFYCDIDFVKNVPVDTLISKAYADQRRALIDRTKAQPRFDVDSQLLRQGDTVCLAVGDKFGNMVSLIQSNYCGLGSGMTPPGLGFVLQNRGCLFDLTEGRNNSYAPRKRPFHTIIPAFVTKDNAPYLAMTVMGGGFQPQGHCQVLINHIDFGMNLQEAGDAARIEHHGSSEPTGSRMNDGGCVALESGLDGATAGLAALGHRFENQVGIFGGYQAVMRLPTGVYVGATESRKDGVALGY